MRRVRAALPLLAACAALLAACAALPLLGGCGLPRMLAGADFDAGQLEAERDAAVAGVRAQGAKRLAQRLTSGLPADDADIVLSLGSRFVQKAALQLVGSRGWIDERTSYVIKGVTVELQYGSAVAALQLRAHNDTWAVDVDLVMDCIMSLRAMKNELSCVLEPFHVAPTVTTPALLSQLRDIIRDVLTVRIATISRDLQPITFPMTIRNQYALEQSVVPVRGAVNLDLFTPRRAVDYALRIKDVYVLREAVILAIDITGTGAQ